jgi:hypothetical protein
LGLLSTSVVYGFCLSLMKDHFLHRDLVLFVLLQYVLDLSDFDLSGSSFWSASHFCLLLHWPALCLALDSFCRGCFFFYYWTCLGLQPGPEFVFAASVFRVRASFNLVQRHWVSHGFGVSVSLPVYLDFQFLVPASQGDGGPAVHWVTLLLGVCSSVVFFGKFLVCESLQRDSGIALELPD